MVTATATSQTEEPIPRPEAVNARPQRRTLENLERFDGADSQAIETRIAELKREWDMERALDLSAATLAIVGVGLGRFVHRRWLSLPMLIGGFLIQHAIQGWCPLVPVLRRLGRRTAIEIHEEITALKIMRGDFGSVSDPASALQQASLRFH